MFERFTDSARRALVQAQEESRLLNHDRIGTEHLLLALLHADADETARALHEAGVTLEAARERIGHSRHRGKTRNGHIPFTPRAKKVLELATRASHPQSQGTVGDSNLLCALLEVRDGAAFELLVKMGIDIQALAAVSEALRAKQPAGFEPGPQQLLARGLQRYGRHEDQCDPDSGCTCGLAELLEIASREQPHE